MDFQSTAPANNLIKPVREPLSCYH
jgi:hypothetical protein